MKTARFLAGELGRLDAAGIRSFVIRGNHDALSRITRELVLPDSVRLFGGRAEAVPVEAAAGPGGGAPPVVVHGLSFAQPHAPDSLLPRYRPPVEGAVNIGLMHTSLGGAAGHDPYAPCSLGELQASGFRYWALGHVHRRAVAAGACTVVMPGMPQGRDINESGPKSATLATVGDDGTIRVEERPTGIAQFERVEVDLAGIDDWRGIAAAIAAALEQARGRATSEHLVARLTLAGATPLAWRARRDADLLKAEADHRAAATGRCWVEKLEIACTPPAAAGPGAGGADPVAELRQLVAAEVLGSEAYRAAATAAAEELRGQLPAECRGLLGSDEAGFRAALDALALEGAEDVLARLHAGPPAGDG